jgi:hypothetical protein
VLRGELRAPVLVEPDVGEVVAQGAVDGHDREQRRQPNEGVDRRGLGGDHHDPVDTLVPQLVGSVGDRRLVEPGQAGDAHEVAGRAGRVLDAGHDAGRAEQRGVEADHPEHPGPPGGQGARGEVTAVSQLLDGGQDGDLGARRHARVLVEHPGDRLVRDAGQPGDVGHRRGPARLHHGGCSGLRFGKAAPTRAGHGSR